jgi:hypothetical protein
MIGPEWLAGVAFGASVGLIAISLRDLVNHHAWLHGWVNPRRACEGCGEVFETRMSDDELCWVVPPHGHPLHPNGCPGGRKPGSPT